MLPSGTKEKSRWVRSQGRFKVPLGNYWFPEILSLRAMFSLSWISCVTDRKGQQVRVPGGPRGLDNTAAVRVSVSAFSSAGRSSGAYRRRSFETQQTLRLFTPR